jgi:hypothetical protein
MTIRRRLAAMAGQVVDPSSPRLRRDKFWNAAGAVATLETGAALTGMAGGNLE